ncbi:hypothetical protein CQW23_12462 [Capsicum baccatum]|uniref:Receptor-like protein 12 n=1 Tax=Capsicum baccatum TaxID=33114 RepID=A0A2G2WSP0_CAPBA|nr:hypothetical protein CQW23_12462 [Capsicum baccatum]
MLLQNLTQLRELHLSGVNISSTIPLNSSSHLTTIGLRRTGLYRIIRESIFNLPNLETLDLSCNDQLNGYFPATKWNSSASLKEFDLIGVNFSVSEGCGSNLIPEKNNTKFVPNEEDYSTFLSELCWEVVLIGYGCGFIIGFSIEYIMLSSRKLNWLSRIAEELEYRISMKSRKKLRESHLMSCTNLNQAEDFDKNSCLTMI